MTQYTFGQDAINALNASDDSNAVKNEFAKLPIGKARKVKVIDPNAIASVFTYSIYKLVNTFIAKNPSKKSRNGYPIADYTPFDKAWKYHKDLSQDFSDAHGQEAGKYRTKARSAIGFYDLTEGKLIVVDLTKAQAQVVTDAIAEYEDELTDLAFTLKKTGDPKQPTSTAVSLTPIINRKKGLTDEESKNFDNAPTEFDFSLFDGIYFEMDEDAQVQALKQVGFDVSLIGYDANAGGGTAPDISEDDEEALPF